METIALIHKIEKSNQIEDIQLASLVKQYS